MSSAKPKKNDNNKNSGWIDVKSNNNESPSAKRRRRRKRSKANKNSPNNKPKTISTKPKHAAPPNASTIYCQWFQEGICHRGKKCFFIHELDPLSEKNPIEHKKMLKNLLSPEKKTNANVQVQLKKPTKPWGKQQQSNSDEFLLPSQNKAFQQSINNNKNKKKYDRYSDFDPNANPNTNTTQPTQQIQPQLQSNINNLNYNNNQPPNPYTVPFQPQIIPQIPMYPPNPYAIPIQPIIHNINAMNFNNNNNNNNNGNNSTFAMNANATEFVPALGAVTYSPITQTINNTTTTTTFITTITTPTKQQPHYNPYLTAENAHTADPNGISSNFGSNSQKQGPSPQGPSPSKFNAEEALIENPEAFNEDDYEVFEDENGEIIVVEKDQLYGDDPYYHDQKLLREFNKERAKNDPNFVGNGNNKQRGIRGGGQTYNYGAGAIPNDADDDEEKKETPSRRRKRRGKRGKGSGYASAAAKFGNVYPAKGRVESFDNHSNPDYDPNAKICRFWLNGKCAYNENCKMAHRFETNKCPHCDKNIGKSPLIQQQHLANCSCKLTLDTENKMSEAQECGICRENILEKGSKFGLLTGCKHAFCLQCIREWRGVLNQSKEVVRACPICRKVTWFIVPCDRFIVDEKRKEREIDKYKERLSKVRCKHFDEDEDCPFGSSCFYMHVKKDGTIDEKKVNLRHMINADGETEIMKQMKLSEFLFGE